MKVQLFELIPFANF